jgi:exopolyphosphatase/guanosine-5'-triphosphate,3'-diphosphate pyrophosphatase
MKERWEFDPKTDVKAIGTEALRRAKNRNGVLAQIRRETGVRIKVIPPEREAILGALGVERCLRVNQIGEPHHFLMVDIGGGSTEITLKHRQGIVSRSFPIGIVKLAEEFKTPEQIAIYLKKFRPKIREYLKTLFATFRKPKILVGSSGTPTTLANLKQGGDYRNYDKFRVNGTTLTQGELDYWLNRLLGMEMKKREELVGVGRGDLIGAGILILKEILKLADYREVVACNDGVLEGIGVDWCKRESINQQLERLKKLREQKRENPNNGGKV